MRTSSGAAVPLLRFPEPRRIEMVSSTVGSRDEDRLEAAGWCSDRYKTCRYSRRAWWQTQCSSPPRQLKRNRLDASIAPIERFAGADRMPSRLMNRMMPPAAAI